MNPEIVQQWRGTQIILTDGQMNHRAAAIQTVCDLEFDRVRTLGLPYDPNTSEAIQIEDVEDPNQDGMVIRELVRGYRLDEHVVRAARVVVGRYTAPPKEDSGETLRIEEEGGDEGGTVADRKDEQQ